MRALVDFGASDLSEADFDYATFESGLSRKCEALVLDRGVFNPFGSLPTLAFPRYSEHRFNAADSCLLHEITLAHGIDLFIGFGNTSPLTVPMIQVIVDMPIREREARISRRQRDEWDIALHFAQMIMLGPAVDRDQFAAAFPDSSEKVLPSLAACLDEVMLCERSPQLVAFFEEWSRLRRLQASVDLVIWDPK